MTFTVPENRLPLLINDAVVGSVKPDDAAWLVSALADVHTLSLNPSKSALCLRGSHHEINAVLNAMAVALRDAGRMKAWRNEKLAVCDAAGTQQGEIERAAVRVLGITSTAVHVVGMVKDSEDKTDKVWLQHRAANKSTGAGLWDTLAGGLVPAGESLEQGAYREAQEEAGLLPHHLQSLRYLGYDVVEKNVKDGFMREISHTYLAILRNDYVPQNHDGEVQGFALLSWANVKARMAAGLVTEEAILSLDRGYADIFSKSPIA